MPKPCQKPHDPRLVEARIAFDRIEPDPIRRTPKLHIFFVNIRDNFIKRPSGKSIPCRNCPGFLWQSMQVFDLSILKQVGLISIVVSSTSLDKCSKCELRLLTVCRCWKIRRRWWHRHGSFSTNRTWSCRFDSVEYSKGHLVFLRRRSESMVQASWC